MSELAQKGGKARRQHLRDAGFVGDDAATASAIEAELDDLRAQVEQLTEERDAAVEKLEAIRRIVAS